VKKEEKIKLLNEPLDVKLKRTKMLIIEWYEQFNGQVYVAFSGGKDSTVLLDIARRLYPDIEAVFADTGLEFPEIRAFAKKMNNTTFIKPKMSHPDVLEKYGFPIISKEQSQYIQQYRNAKSEKTKDTRWNGNKWGQGKISEKWKFLVKAPFKISEKCCDIFKKDPFKRFEKETGKKGIVGVMAGESSHRKTYYYRTECNAFNAKRPLSKPIWFWNEHDIWKYIRDFNVEYSPIYDMGYERTGCMFCMYGHQMEVDRGEETRFDKIKKTHPKLYKYCMDKLGLRKVIEFYSKKKYE